MNMRVPSRIVVLTLLLVAALMAVSITAAQDDEVVVSAGDEVVIGFAAGLSGEGIAPLGTDIQRGVELALADRPAVVINGAEFPVVLDVQDSLCNAEGGQTVANRFVSNPSVVAVVGDMCSSSCFAGAPIYDSAGYTMVSPSCTNPSLTLRGFTSFNRAVASDGFQGAVAADFIFNNLGFTRVATIHDGSPYGEGLVSVLTSAFEALGGEVVAADAVTVGDTSFTSLLEEIARSDPEIIYFGGFPAEAARLIQQRADAGLEDVAFIGADGILGTEVVDLAGMAAEGTFASAPTPSTSDALEAFLERYIETFGETPPAPFHANGYDSFNIIMDAIEATATVNDAGELVISRSALSDFIRSIEGYEGLTGRLDADGQGELVSPDRAVVAISQVQGGEFVQVAVVGGEAEEAATLSIVDIALGDDSFSTLVMAVLSADPAVVETISGTGPFTVFAPTDAAFAATLEAIGLDAGDLLADTELLTSILLYHVVDGAVFAGDLVEAGSGAATTLLGEDISFEVTEDGVVLNGTVNVIAADVVATNGVIHVIDAVLLPPSE